MSNDTECCAAYSDDCKLFAYSSPDGRLKIWDTESGALKQEYVPSSHLSVAATCLSWRGQSAVEAPRHRKQRARSSGGGGAAPLLALGTPAGSVLVYSVLAGDLQTELGGGGAGHGGAAVHCVAWDAAGQHVFSGGADGHVLQWAVKNGKVKCKLKVGKSPVYSVCPLPDGATALAAGRTISWWELATGAQLRSYPGHATPVTYLQHVPLPGLDGDGGYFISAAAAGRVVSAWQLSRETSPGGAQPTASVSFALSAEPRQVSVARRPDGEAVLVTAVTATGLLHVFEKQLNGVRKKPVKPKLTVRVASDGKSPKPLPVLCARPGDEEPTHLHLCHGSFLRPAFERLPYETDEPSLCLVRADPAAATSSAASAAVSRVKTPATDGPVRQLAAGLLSTGRKRRTSETAATPAPAQLPLEQRLGGLVAAAGAGRPTAPPSASSMAQLLVQGLASRDRAMLRTVLDTEEPAVVRSTVQALPLDAVLPLIDRLGHMLRFADQSFSALRWLRAVMERHSSYLLTQTDLDTVLAPVYSSVQVRLRCFPRLLQLRGRLELLAGQVAARQRKTAGAAATAEPAEPLFTYRDDSSDDEGDMLGRPPPSPDDVSEMSDDADLDDADDQAMEDEDGDDDGSEDEDGAEDPDEDDEDIEDSGDEDEDELMNGD